MKTAEQLRADYLEFAANMEPPPESKYARALGAMSADFEGLLAMVEQAVPLLKVYDHVGNVSRALFFLDQIKVPRDPSEIRLPLRKKPTHPAAS